jgi:hypothetical protein
MNLETRLRGRPRNRWQDEVREDGKGWLEKVYNRGMEEAPEKSKESSHSARANGMNEWTSILFPLLSVHNTIYICIGQ